MFSTKFLVLVKYGGTELGLVHNTHIHMMTTIRFWGSAYQGIITQFLIDHFYTEVGIVSAQSDATPV